MKNFYRELGRRLRNARTVMNISQEKAGEGVEVSFQMIQKYEAGKCRIPVDKLLELARLYKVSVAMLVDADTETGEKDDALMEELTRLRVLEKNVKKLGV